MEKPRDIQNFLDDTKLCSGPSFHIPNKDPENFEEVVCLKCGKILTHEEASMSKKRIELISMLKTLIDKLPFYFWGTPNPEDVLSIAFFDWDVDTIEKLYLELIMGVFQHLEDPSIVCFIEPGSNEYQLRFYSLREVSSLSEEMGKIVDEEIKGREIIVQRLVQSKSFKYLIERTLSLLPPDYKNKSVEHYLRIIERKELPYLHPKE